METEESELWFEYTYGELYEHPEGFGLHRVTVSLEIFEALLAVFLAQVAEESVTE